MTKEEAKKAGYYHWSECSVMPCVYTNDAGEFITLNLQGYEIAKDNGSSS